MWYTPLSKWCCALLRSKYIKSAGKTWFKWFKWDCGEFLQGKRPWENMSPSTKSVLFLEAFGPQDWGESYHHQFRVTTGMGQAKGCCSCPTEISLGNKPSKESSSCLFFSAVSLVLPCSKIRSHMPIKTALRLATPAWYLFQNSEIPTQPVTLQRTGPFWPFWQVSAFSLKSSNTLLHLVINLRSLQHQPSLK